MKALQVYTLLAVILLCTAGCKKSTSSNPPVSGDFLVSGKGVKAVYNHTFANDGLMHSYFSTQISVQDDGNVSWCYGQSQNFGQLPLLFRPKINVATGDTLAADGSLAKFTQKELFSSGTPWSDGIYYVQGTGKLYQSTKGYAIGDVPTYEVRDLSFNAAPRIYSNGDAVISANPSPIQTSQISYVAQMWAHRRHAGINKFYLTQQSTGTDQRDWWHGGICFPADNAGSMYAFTANQRSAFLINMDASTQTNTVIADSTPFSVHPQANAVNILIRYYVKTTADNSKTVILSREYGNTIGENYFSTFVINNLTHKIALVVNKAPLDGLYDWTRTVDFDMSGNIYYIKWSNNDPSSALAIVKQTQSGTTELKSGFLTGGVNPYEIAVSNTGKVFLAVGSSTTINNELVARLSLCTFD